MNTVDRTKTPLLHEIQKIELLEPKVLPMGTHSEWIWMNDVNDETVQLTLVFNAGTIQGEMLIASITNALLFSGTATKTSTDISDELSKLGAYFSSKIEKEESSVSVFCLREYFDEVMTIVIDAIENVTFLDDEITEVRQDKKQAFLLGQKKSSWLATRLFTQNLCANKENYSRISELSDYDVFNRQQLIDFHQQYYLKGLKQVICIANLEEAIIQKWVTKLSKWNDVSPTDYIENIENQPTEIYQEMDKMVQTSLRIGIPLFNRTNPDYVKMYVLNTVLGSYFGSRLMANLREDKGYTYGIGSSIGSFLNAGYLSIGADVKKEVREDALTQIKYEIQRLKEELISEDELNLVKNYIVGQFLQMADGSDAMTMLFIASRKYGMDNTYYDRFLAEVKAVTSEELQEAANQYLIMEKATIIMVG